MEFSFSVFVLLMVHFLPSDAVENEPTCSKFPYEEQLLGKMTRVEVKMEQWDKELKKFEESVLSILEHRREEIKYFVEEYRKLKDDQNKKMEEISAEHKELRQDIRNRTIEGPDTPIVAFNSYISTSGTYTKNQILKFPHILLNKGGGYDSTSGYFTAPVSGLYQFFAHICNQHNKYIHYAIVHGETIVAKSAVFEDQSVACASVGALVQMKADERVCVQSTHPDSRLYTHNTYRWPSFMGVLLHMSDKKNLL